MIDFIYFDLGNVICLFDHEIACRNMGRLAGASADEVRREVFESDLQHRYEIGRVTCAEFTAEFSRRLAVRVNQTDLLHAASDMFRLNQPMVNLIHELRRGGRRVGVLSNTCPAHWEFCNRTYDVEQLFDVSALSYELALMKPMGEIYDRAAELSGVVANRIFFVDDRLENVAAAREAGFVAHQYRSVDSLRRELFSQLADA